MALIPKNTYPGQTIADDAGYPQGAPRNATSLNDGTGFPIERRWIADIFGLLQSLLDDAGITPSGNPDRVGESQYLQALHALFFDEQEVSNEIDSRLGS